MKESLIFRTPFSPFFEEMLHIIRESFKAILKECTESEKGIAVDIESTRCVAIVFYVYKPMLSDESVSAKGFAVPIQIY